MWRPTSSRHRPAFVASEICRSLAWALCSGYPATDIRGVQPPGITTLDFFTGLFLGGVVLMPLETLAHELGHGLVAVRASRGPVRLYVGRPPFLIEARFGRMSISWSPLPTRGVPFGGLCVWHPRRATPSGRLAVIVAGPIVTAIFVLLFLLAAFQTAQMPGLIPATFLGAAMISFITLLMGADPRPANARERAEPDGIRRDGPQARAAYRAWRNEMDG
jgi:hypothetical protein